MAYGRPIAGHAGCNRCGTYGMRRVLLPVVHTEKSIFQASALYHDLTGTHITESHATKGLHRIQEPAAFVKNRLPVLFCRFATAL